MCIVYEVLALLSRNMNLFKQYNNKGFDICFHRENCPARFRSKTDFPLRNSAFESSFLQFFSNL